MADLEAARMFREMHSGRHDTFLVHVRAESRAFGISLLAGNDGTRATHAFARFIRLVEFEPPNKQ